VNEFIILHNSSDQRRQLQPEVQDDEPITRRRTISTALWSTGVGWALAVGRPGESSA